MTENTLVVQAFRRVGAGARFGYFSSIEDVPEGWEISDANYDIADIMEYSGVSREQALVMMNR